MSIPKILTVAAYGILSLATFELAARIDDFWRERAQLFSPYSINTLFQSSKLGKEGVPYAKYAKWQMNSLGFRGPEPVKNRENILVFGASESFGLYESPDHEYPRVTEKILNEATGDRFNVINTAIPGIRVGRVSYLDAAMTKTRPKYVVVYPSPANYIGVLEPFCHQQVRPIVDQRSLSDYLRFLGKTAELGKKILPERIKSLAGEFEIWRAAKKETPTEKVSEKTLDAMAEDFGCVIRSIRQAGAEPIFVTHATFFGATFNEKDRQMLSTWRRFYPNLLEDGFIDLEHRTNKILKLVSDRENVRLVDAANQMPGGSEYFADFVHFTDKGAKKMAELVAAGILEHPSLNNSVKK
jgi:lysophospholipase L1-like esterase